MLNYFFVIAHLVHIGLLLPIFIEIAIFTRNRHPHFGLDGIAHFRSLFHRQRLLFFWFWRWHFLVRHFFRCNNRLPTFIVGPYLIRIYSVNKTGKRFIFLKRNLASLN